MPSSASSSSPQTPRPYDLVIYGAYGYTGTLTVQYLVKAQLGRKVPLFKWAVAGRSKSKLEALVKSVLETESEVASQSNASSSSPLPITLADIIVASTDDDSSLRAMCAQTAILLTFAGPYLKCGLPIVSACIRSGTHYMDITGEMSFIRRLVDEGYHDDAKARKVAIINSCGFDCVPSDLGSMMMHDFVVGGGENGGEFITSMRGYFTLIGDLDPSGGTAATLGNTFLTSTAEDESPLSINPPQYRSRIPAPIRKWMRWTPILNKYSGPFLMACENERIVRRSNCLLGRPQVAYAEAVCGGFMAVLMELLQFYAINILLPIALFNKIVLFFLPKPGAGPDAQRKKGSHYQATFVAETNKGRTIRGDWYDDRNAYDTTAVFVVEAVVCLLQGNSNKATSGGEGSATATALQYGVVTPAAALGKPYLEALTSRCGIRTEISVVMAAEGSTSSSFKQK